MVIEVVASAIYIQFLVIHFITKYSSEITLLGNWAHNFI